ncbi:MAG: DUF2059 domain-containing protein [Burkholderiales bacterium]
MFKSAIAIIILTIAGAVNAETAIPPEKEQLIQHVLQLWPVENIGVATLQESVVESVRKANSLLMGRVSAERRDAAMKDINEDAKKFMDEATPVVRASAKKFIPTVVVPLLAEKFNNDELRQIIAMLESPVKSKFEAAIPVMQQALGEKIAADSAAKINPKLEEFKQQVAKRMHTATGS